MILFISRMMKHKGSKPDVSCSTPTHALGSIAGEPFSSCSDARWTVTSGARARSHLHIALEAPHSPQQVSLIAFSLAAPAEASQSPVPLSQENSFALDLRRSSLDDDERASKRNHSSRDCGGAMRREESSSMTLQMQRQAVMSSLMTQRSSASFPSALRPIHVGHAPGDDVFQSTGTGTPQQQQQQQQQQQPRSTSNLGPNPFRSFPTTVRDSADPACKEVCFTVPNHLVPAVCFAVQPLASELTRANSRAAAESSRFAAFDGPASTARQNSCNVPCGTIEPFHQDVGMSQAPLFFSSECMDCSMDRAQQSPLHPNVCPAVNASNATASLSVQNSRLPPSNWESSLLSIFCEEVECE